MLLLQLQLLLQVPMLLLQWELLMLQLHLQLGFKPLLPCSTPSLYTPLAE
jgi:hypothetical protein